jgi:hypothetical protein
MDDLLADVRRARRELKRTQHAIRDLAVACAKVEETLYRAQCAQPEEGTANEHDNEERYTGVS